MKVKNLVSAKGNPTPNQFTFRTDEGIYFQSYESIIVFIPKNGQTILDEDKWDYSKTTGKYRNLFLGEKKEETERKIKNGTYVLKNLNKCEAEY